jgi:serine/threonine-protein kinase
METGGSVEHQGPAAIEAGTRLGEYEIGRLVGVGSMGAVYEGLRAATGTRVAIKVLSPELEAVPAARARFLKEAKLTARVRHSNIVNVTDVGEDTGRSYLVMDMLEGEDLARRLASGPLAVAEAADLLGPVCDAVAAAHDRGVTHRDLKPSNIFLAMRGGRAHPIVLDFGIAKDDDGGAVDGGATTASGIVFGTPYYLSPEQVADHRAAGPASDQYALGVILYECLTGQRPYVGETIEEVFRAIVAGKPTAPSALRSQIPTDVEEVVLRAMHADPKARFASVAALGRALRSFDSKASVEVLLPPETAAPKSGPDALAASPEIARSAGRRRPPSSPAIEVEAATPTPFVRTLTPEIEALGGPWFAAPESSEEIVGEAIIPIASETAAVATDSPLGFVALAASGEAELAGGERAVETLVRLRSKVLSNRRWAGAAAGGALAVVVFTFLATRGSSAPRPPLVVPAAPAPAIARTEPAALPAPIEPVAAPTPRAAVAPAEPAATPTAQSAPPRAEPVAAPVAAAAVEPAAASGAPVPAAPAEAVAAPAAAAKPRMEAVAEPAAAVPARVEAVAAPAARAEPVARPSAPKPAPTSIGGERAEASPRPTPSAPQSPAVRDAAPKPRPRASSAVRTHNGVPLLD